MTKRQVFITGASSDIGCAICKLYLAEGYSVVGHYYNGQPAFFDLVESSPNMTAIQIDFADPQNLEDALKENPKTFLGTDVVVNASAFYEGAPFADITAQAILRIMTVNVLPGLQLMRTIAPAMVERGWGRIVHLSSIGVKFGGGSNSFAYALSKHAMEFMPSDHKGWAARNVFVNVIRVGVTDTRFHDSNPDKDLGERVSMIPAGRMASPDEIAKTVYWHGSENNSFTTGQVIAVAGGE
jgi:NAD(P)-dependent dehydrogenase (short-subunit alcohol dehydrogenase family)